MPSAAEDSIHVALAVHDARGTYWPYAAVTITSLCQHASVPVVIHLLHDDTLGSEARQVIAAIVAAYGHRLQWHPVALPAAVQALDFTHFTAASAWRLMLPRLLADLPWVLYLDADIVCHRFDIARFGQWLQAQPGEQPIAAVHDDLFAVYAEGRAELAMLGLAAADYINSGVLVLRPALIGEDLPAALAAFGARHPQALHLDQDLLNDVFRGRIQHLPADFNHQVNLSHGRCFAPLSALDGKVLHYSGKIKPLSGKFSPADLCFWRYTQHIPDIGRFVGQPFAYLQKIHTGHSNARVVSCVAKDNPTP